MIWSGGKMEKKIDLPKRKRNRLKNYDYDSCGAYFITICTSGKKNYFWEHDNAAGSFSDLSENANMQRYGDVNVGAIIDRPQGVRLTRLGQCVNEAINRIPAVYTALAVENYVIMPNHIHVLLQVNADECGRPLVAPTLLQVVKQLKGYVSKSIGKTIWQKSFYDHIIRNWEDYAAHLKYIYENPTRWAEDELYSAE